MKPHVIILVALWLAGVSACRAQSTNLGSIRLSTPVVTNEQDLVALGALSASGTTWRAEWQQAAGTAAGASAAVVRAELGGYSPLPPNSKDTVYAMKNRAWTAIRSQTETMSDVANYVAGLYPVWQAEWLAAAATAASHATNYTDSVHLEKVIGRLYDGEIQMVYDPELDRWVGGGGQYQVYPVSNRTVMIYSRDGVLWSASWPWQMTTLPYTLYGPNMAPEGWPPMYPSVQLTGVVSEPNPWYFMMVCVSNGVKYARQVGVSWGIGSLPCSISELGASGTAWRAEWQVAAGSSAEVVRADLASSGLAWRVEWQVAAGASAEVVRAACVTNNGVSINGVPLGNGTNLILPGATAELAPLKTRLDNVDYDQALQWFYLSSLSTVYALPMAGQIFDGMGDTNGLAITEGSNWVWGARATQIGVGTTVGSIAGHWLLNESNANTTVTGTVGANGTAQNNTSTMAITGRVNRAFRFNGTSDYVTWSPVLGAPTGYGYTFSMWLYPTNSTIEQCILLNGVEGGSAGGWTLVRGGSGGQGDRKLYFLRNGSGWDDTGVTIPDNQWTHLIFSRTGTWSCNIWSNGVLYPFTMYPYILNGGTPTTVLGGSPPVGNRRWYGYIDDFRFYNYCLSDGQAKALYNDGTGTEADTATIASNGVLRSRGYAVTSHQPNQAQLSLLFSTNYQNSVINTNIIGYVSRDNGTAWTRVVLENAGSIAGTSYVYRSAVSNFVGGVVSNVVRWRIDSFTNSTFVRGVSLSTQE